MKKNLSTVSKKGKKQHGVAVIFSLGILGLLTVMALGFASTALLNNSLSKNVMNIAYARSLAKNLALIRISNPHFVLWVSLILLSLQAPTLALLLVLLAKFLVSFPASLACSPLFWQSSFLLALPGFLPVCFVPDSLRAYLSSVGILAASHDRST